MSLLPEKWWSLINLGLKYVMSLFRFLVHHHAGHAVLCPAIDGIFIYYQTVLQGNIIDTIDSPMFQLSHSAWNYLGFRESQFCLVVHTARCPYVFKVSAIKEWTWWHIFKMVEQKTSTRMFVHMSEWHHWTNPQKKAQTVTPKPDRSYRHSIIMSFSNFIEISKSAKKCTPPCKLTFNQSLEGSFNSALLLDISIDFYKNHLLRTGIFPERVLPQHAAHKTRVGTIKLMSCSTAVRKMVPTTKLIKLTTAHPWIQGWHCY